MRFGGIITMLSKMMQRFKDNNKSKVKMMFFQTIADIFGIIYLAMDHPLYFVKTGFITTWNKSYIAWWDRIADMMWLFQVICELLCHMRAIDDMQTNLASLKQKRDKVKSMCNGSTENNSFQKEGVLKKLAESNLEVANAEKEYLKKCRSFVRLLLDVPTAMYCTDLYVNAQVGGACGTLATCISIYEILNK